ncbi:PREDICTED: protein FAM179A-like, partial [Chaetura pelagica]|uniref:protein FAM179A-like n=1 Tax=Chaetura pelagica TaxID=8897 RepID=UPI0005231090
NQSLAISLDSLERGEKTGYGVAWEARPFSQPQQVLVIALRLLSSNNWEQQMKGLFNIRHLAICHSEILLSRLHDVSVAITEEVKKHHSKVSGCAVVTLGELFKTLRKQMDQEVDTIASVLIPKLGDSSKLIREAADQSLGVMVVNVTPARAKTALMATGVRHCNALVRKCAAKHLLTVMEHMGAEKLLSGRSDRTQLLLCALVRLARDSQQDTRCYGQQMLNILMSHPKFGNYLRQPAFSHDLEEIMATMKKRGKEDHKCEPPSAGDPRVSKNSNLKTFQDKLPSGPGGRTLPCQKLPHTSAGTVEDTAQLLELKGLLTAQEFQSRMKGLVLLLDLCKSNPQLISSHIFQIFGVLVLTLQDCHKRVSQQALEVFAVIIPILRGALKPVTPRLMTAVLSHLNSKDSGIYAGAVKVLEASVAHL